MAGNFHTVLKEIEQGKFKPVYFLCGDEPYFSEQVIQSLLKNSLQEHERDFNLSIFYGNDIDINALKSTIKQYPMMAERQVVLIREAQSLKKIEELEPVIIKPVPTTVLIMDYRAKSPDKRKKLGKYLATKTVYLQSEKIKDHHLPAWISDYVSSQGFKITGKAANMLADYIGNNLVKVTNEIKKLSIILPSGSEITPEVIERNIGISKDYNIFELLKAIGKRDVRKSFEIADYFAKHPKEHHLIPTLSQFYNYFTKLILLHEFPQKGNRSAVSKLISVNEHFVWEYQDAIKNYSLVKAIHVISLLREYDLKIKGVNNSSLDGGDLLKELLLRVLSDSK